MTTTELAAGVVIRELHGHAEFTAACALFDGIWRPGPAISTEWLVALAHAGNYLGGAFAGPELVGACVGFFAAGHTLHSHIAGVAATSRARNVGFALKLHQRAWALERGLTRITWTFDPLVRRNAYFNVAKLGALPTTYLTDFYGPVADSVNGGDATDRLLVEWHLDSARIPAVATGAEVLGISADERPWRRSGRGPVMLVAVPADIERMRKENPALATEWRSAVRSVLGGLLASGARITGFTRSGRYVTETS